MPSLDEVLAKTMLLSAAPKPLTLQPLSSDADVQAAEPNPVLNRDHDVRRNNPVWSWAHKGADPAAVTGLKSKVLGMGMDYRHAMPVCSEIRLDEVWITLKSGKDLPLPLTSSHVMRKYFLNEGSLPDSTQGLWRLETKVDKSLLVVFGYKIDNGGQVAPLTVAEAVMWGQGLMPSSDSSPAPGPASVGEIQNLLLGPLRVLVCFSLTCCKENPDFTPGDILGMNRIYPHVMIMCSSEVARASAVVSVTRPPNTIPHDSEMGSQICPAFYTDNNTRRGDFIGPPIPLWSNIFDYYQLDPLGQSIRNATMVDGDPSSPRAKVRKASHLVQKEKPGISFTPTFYEDVDLVKQPRQGDFDNLHLAPRMSVRRDPANKKTFDPIFRASLDFNNVSMAPFCIHDCLHMHCRWGIFKDIPKSIKGFDNNFNPNTVDGAPLLPHNQSVRITLFPPAGFGYEGIVHGPVQAGRWHVIFHHGLGYANEIWDTNKMDAARTGVELFSLANVEENLTPVTATNSFALFYWRLRYGGQNNVSQMERLIYNTAAVSL